MEARSGLGSLRRGIARLTIVAQWRLGHGAFTFVLWNLRLCALVSPVSLRSLALGSRLALRFCKYFVCETGRPPRPSALEIPGHISGITDPVRVSASFSTLAIQRHSTRTRGGRGGSHVACKALAIFTFTRRTAIFTPFPTYGRKLIGSFPRSFDH